MLREHRSHLSRGDRKAPARYRGSSPEPAGWTLAHTGESEVRAIRKTRTFSFENRVTARLTPVGSSGASMNTYTEFESVARLGVWDPGQNKRNLKELLAAIELQLRAQNH